MRLGLGIAQYSRGQYEDGVKTVCRAAAFAPADPLEAKELEIFEKLKAGSR